MRKFKLFIALAVAAALFAAAPAQAALQDMWAYVYSWKGAVNSDGKMQLTRITSGITFQVLQRNSDTAETLYVYASKANTALTNPVTTANFESATVCNDRVAFRVDPTEANDRYVDLIVVNTAGGFTAFVEDFDKYNHAIVIDERPNVLHHGMIWYSCAATTETDTGIDFAPDTFIHDVRTEVVTTSAGTIDVGLLSSGTGGNAAGFLNDRAISVAGFTADTGVVTSGTSNDYVPATTYGALLYTAVTGANVPNSSAAGVKRTDGGRSYLGHIITGSNETSLTYGCATTAGSGAGYIHYYFTRMR